MTRFPASPHVSLEFREYPVPGAIVELRADVSEGQLVRYSFSVDGGKRFQPLGPPLWLARFSWWKGSRPALFTFTRGEPGGWIDVDWVHVEVQR